MTELQSCFNLTAPPYPQKTQMLCILKERNGFLCLWGDYYYYLVV